MPSYRFTIRGKTREPLRLDDVQLADDQAAVAYADKLLSEYRSSLRVEIWQAGRRVESLPPFFVAIGASGGGGLRDIRALLAALPANLPAVVLVVLHRPSDRLSYLREVLARSSNLPVVIAEDDDQFRIGTCYIGEPDQHLALAEKSRVELVAGGHDAYRNRTVDLLFNSVAVHAGARGIGIVLSGALDDGSRGLAAIARAGGATMVLTAQGDIQPGMPRNAATYDGPLDFTGSAEEIAAEVARRVQPVRLAPTA